MSSTATVRGSSQSAPNSGGMVKIEDDAAFATVPVTPTPSKDPKGNNDNSATDNNSNFFANATNRFLQKYPLMAQWKSRRAFVTAQYQVFGILAISYVLNRWPVSYPREENANETMFWLLMMAMGVGTFYTLKHEKSSRGIKLLSRDQTEEWKGWMQFVFIMYHYYRNRSIYNEIRVLVSAYVWMTGFGNFLYFNKTQDFSLERMVSMWLRINYFPLMLSIFLNVKLELYYVVPLHTVGFFMTMATCYIAKSLRDKHKMDLVRSNVAAIGISLLAHIVFFETPLAEAVLSRWSHEYEFRFQTDKYSAWFGVLCGFLWSRFQSYMTWCYGDDGSSSSSTDAMDSPTSTSAGIGSGGSGDQEEKQQQKQQQSKTTKPLNIKKQQAMHIQRGVGVALLLIWFFGFGTEDNKRVYNPKHPYIFWMPLAGYLMLRNSSKYLTEVHSTVLEFVGRITLETYVLQFHVFMCQNVQHIPVVIPGSGPDGFFILKFANMLATGAFFVALAWYARRATVATQDSVTELVTDLKKKMMNWGSKSRGESLAMKTKPTLGIIDEPDDTTPLTPPPQKDKKDEEA